MTNILNDYIISYKEGGWCYSFKGGLIVDDNVNMNVSPVMGEKGHKYAFVSFNEGDRSAEGRIPECEIFTNKGFTDDEVKSLEAYMRENLAYLKKVSSGVNVMKAFMK